MATISENRNENWKKLVSSLKKGVEELEKDRKAGKLETPDAVEVICSQEDIERTRQGWKNKKR